MTIETLLPSDTFMTAAFDELLADVTNLRDQTKAQRPCDKDELKFWTAQANALNKAQYQWSQGVRPTSTGASWLMPSMSRPGALIHRLTKLGGIWICSCEGRRERSVSITSCSVSSSAPANWSCWRRMRRSGDSRRKSARPAQSICAARRKDDRR